MKGMELNEMNRKSVLKTVGDRMPFAGHLVVLLACLAAYSPLFFAVFKRCSSLSEPVTAFVCAGLFLALPIIFLFAVAVRKLGRARFAVFAAVFLSLAVMAHWGCPCWKSAGVPTRAGPPVYFYAGTSVLAVIIALASAYRKLAPRDPRGRVRLGALALLALPFLYLAHDTPPIKNDYTWNDVLPDWPGAKESSRVLFKLQRGKNVITLTATNSLVSNTPASVIQFADDVERIWADIVFGRQLIDELDTYARIADVEDPETLKAKPYEAPIMNYHGYRTLARSYWVYAQLRAEQGRFEEAAAPLIRLHSVACKAFPEATFLVSHMVWLRLIQTNLDRAYRLAARPDCDQATLQALRKAFQPIPWKKASPNRPLIVEYLALQTMVRTVGGYDLLKSYGSFDTGPSRNPLTALANGCLRLWLLPNRTARDQRRILDQQLACIHVNPPRANDVSSLQDEYLKQPPFKNTVGWMLLAIALPDYSKAVRTGYNTSVQSELLAVYLSERAGGSLVLEDPFTRKPYGRTDKGIPFSVGWDGKAGTPDDIVLGNPAT